MSLRAKGFVVVSIPLAAMLFGFLIAYLVNREHDQAELWVSHCQLVHTEVDQLQDIFVNAETGVRGYLLTQNKEFLEPYLTAKQMLPKATTELVELVRDSPQETARLNGVLSIAGENLTLLAKMAAPPADAGAPSVADGEKSALLVEGKRKMDALRREIIALNAVAQQLLAERTAHLESIDHWRPTVDVGGVAFGFLGAFLAVQLFSNGIVTRVLRLRENAARLAEGTALVAMPVGGDEIGVLAQDLERASGLLLERRQALDAALARLRQSEGFYRALAHNFPNGSVFLFDRELRFLVADGSGLAELGPTHAQLEGHTVQEAFPQDTAAKLEPLYRAAFEDVREAQELSHADRLYLLQTLPIKGEDGQIYAGLAVMQDITERKQSEEALRVARDEAVRANAAKSEFLSRMSHELRTPLNAVLGFGQLLEMDPRDEIQRDHIAHILKGGRHLLELINEVLDIARIESGNIHFSMEPVRIDEVVAESIEMIRPLASKRRIALLAPEPGKEDESYVLADQQRLRQIMLNLLSNAIKYNRDEGRVTVSYEQSTSDERLRVVVRDTGPGISTAKQSRLFVPFDRLGAEETRIEGTGLGLALSRRLIEAMNGNMGVNSTVGEGSAFWVELPRTASPATHSQLLPNTNWLFGSSEFAAETAEPSRTILYIEDNLSNLSLVERLLDQMPGTRLLSAMQGTMGLELAREHHPNLILLDLHLPDITGHDVLLRLRAEDNLREVPVVIMSADATPGQITRLMAAGANAYLTKPFQIPEFFRIIEKLIPSESIA